MTAASKAATPIGVAAPADPRPQLYRARNGTTWETDPARPDSVRVHGRDGLWWPLEGIAQLHGLTPIDTTEGAS